MARRLGDILIQDGLITAAQRDEALRLQRSSGGRIGTHLVQLGAIDLETLALALSRQKGVPAAQQRHFDSIHPEAVPLVPAHLARKHGAIPLGFTARSPKTIAVAFLDTPTPGTVDEIQRAAGARVYPVIAPELRIVRSLEKLYGIPRHPRFLQLDGDGDSPGPQARGSRVGDPRSFFDMSRPDLSQPKAVTAILLTEEMRHAEEAGSPAGDRSAPPVRSAQPTAKQALSSATPRSPTPIGTPAQFARPPLPTLNPRAPAPGPTPSPSTRELATSPTPPKPVYSGPRPTPAALRRPPPAVLRRHGEVSEASSRAPTIPGLPDFSDAREMASHEAAGHPPAAPRSRSDSAPTVKRHGSAPAPPLDAASSDPAEAESASGDSPPASIWSPAWRTSQGAASTPQTPNGAPAAADDEPALPPPPPTASARPSPAADDEPAPPPLANAPPRSSSSRDADESEPSPPPPAAPVRQLSAAEAVDAIAVATNREQVADAIVNYLRATCGVGLVLIVQHEVAMGWRGFAPGISDAEMDGLAIPLAAPSVLQIAYQGQRIYRGPSSTEGSALDRQLFERLGVAPPREVVVAPIVIRDRVVNLILGHAEDGGPLPDRVSVGLSTLTRSAAAAYVRLIQETKKRTRSDA